MDRLSSVMILASTALAATLLIGCTSIERGAHPPVGAGAGAEDAAPAGDRIAALALALVGTPYRYGGTEPSSGFDCSGLVFYTYARNGVVVPRTSRDLFKAATKIALDDAAKGDLIFFQDQEKLSHVGIYLGDGRFVHAPSSGRSVSVADLGADYYQQHLVGVGRILPN